MARIIHANAGPVIRRVAAVLLLGLALAAVCAETSLYARVQWWLEDAQQRALARPLAFEHVIAFDVDEESMQRLEGALGAWPYPRDVYARVARYLARHGALVVAYDILFAESRTGDEELARALNRTSVLAGAALPLGARRDDAYRRQLGELALPMSGAPAQHWQDLTLPLVMLTGPSGARVGVISAPADADGVVRSVPLTHEAYGRVLPSLALGALLASMPGALPTFASGELRLGDRAWPLSATGAARFALPANAGAMPVVPFHQLYAATEGKPGTEHIAELVNGKIVYLGSSSAVLGDYVLTPVGQLSGLRFGALAAELLLEGRVLRPPRPALDGMLAALALLLPAAMALRGPKARPRDFAIGFALIPIAAGGAGTALLAHGQQSHWLFAALSGSVSHAAALCAWLLALYRERERLRYEKLAAEQANRMKTAFLNRMTHELRTPLTAITGFNKINQLSDDLGREQRIRNSALIARNCEHLLSLINDQLDSARIEAGQLRLEPRNQDPAALLEEVIATTRVMAQQKGLRLALEVTPPMPTAIRVDPLRLRQVLLNLLGNAIKFTEHGSVTLQAAWQGGILRLSVSDTGPGIPAESLARIFEPFERGVGAGAPGAGLGLAVTRELLRLMGGSIAVTSEVGVGTRFAVELAAPEAPQPVPTLAPAAAIAPSAGAKPLSGSILVAEDNPSLRELLEQQLRALGLQCRLVADGLEAVEAAGTGGFDAVLLDMEMPRMNGWEAAHVLRARGYDRAIVGLTAHESAREADRALNEGCDRVLRKPCKAQDLYETLAQLLDAPLPRPEAGVIQVDSRIADLAERFLNDVRRDAALLRRAVEQRDPAGLRRFGHTLRGSASSFGLDYLARLGGLLEHAARNGDFDAAARVAAQLASHLARVQIRPA